MYTTMNYLSVTKFNRNSYFNNIGAGKYQTPAGQSQLTAAEANELLRAKIAEKEAYKRKATSSKVCVIANRLAKQGMNRSEAFSKAWGIVKAETIETKVSGVTFGNRQKALERLTRYEADKINIRLARESANESDSNAIAVIVTVTGKGSYTIGYLPRTLAAVVAPLIDAGKAVRAMFKEVRGKYHAWHNYGMAVSVSV